MDGGTPYLDSNNRVENTDRLLEGLKMRILVREYAEEAIVDTKAEAGVDVLFRGLEPSITLGLRTTT